MVIKVGVLQRDTHDKTERGVLSPRERRGAEGFWGLPRAIGAGQSHSALRTRSLERLDDTNSDRCAAPNRLSARVEWIYWTLVMSAYMRTRATLTHPPPFPSEIQRLFCALTQPGMDASPGQNDGANAAGTAANPPAGLAGGGVRRSGQAGAPAPAAQKRARSKNVSRGPAARKAPKQKPSEGRVCRRVTACRRRRAVTGPRRMFASHECVGACRDGGNRVHTVDDCANLAWSAAATLSCLRRLSGELEQRD